MALGVSLTDNSGQKSRREHRELFLLLPRALTTLHTVGALGQVASGSLNLIRLSIALVRISRDQRLWSSKST